MKLHVAGLQAYTDNAVVIVADLTIGAFYRTRECIESGALNMRQLAIDKEKESRINIEIVVDAHHSEERAMGWYHYLSNAIQFPFRAKCVVKKRISPLAKGEDVFVTGMSPEEECLHDMYVDIQWKNRTLAVPLVQLWGVGLDGQSITAIEDWHYWVGRAYSF
ncbi:calcium-binding protein [Magnetococcales bacterium HHB-1]